MTVGCYDSWVIGLMLRILSPSRLDECMCIQSITSNHVCLSLCTCGVHVWAITAPLVAYFLWGVLVSGVGSFFRPRHITSRCIRDHVKHWVCKDLKRGVGTLSQLNQGSPQEANLVSRTSWSETQEPNQSNNTGLASSTSSGSLP